MRIADVTFLPLPLGKGEKPGHLSPKLYDGATGRWTATVAVMRFQ